MSNLLAKAIGEAVRIACEKRTAEAVAKALSTIDAASVSTFLHPQLRHESELSPIASGIAASSGAACGKAVFSADVAINEANAGNDVILVRPMTTPEDVLAMRSACGIVTSSGGFASHAAVVARGWGVPAVVGVDKIHIDEHGITIGNTAIEEGDEITIDGGSGEIYAGRQELASIAVPTELSQLLAWADSVNGGHIEFRMNADTSEDAAVGLEAGAQGIGLCRTEHMFLDSERLPAMRRYILSNSHSDEMLALAELRKLHVGDFEQLLDVMDGLPLTVRLLDPPLDEFLPDIFELVRKEAQGTLDELETVELGAARRLYEDNPLIGTRGARLALQRRGLYEMQTQALCEAVSRLKENGKSSNVEIMIPFVVDAQELNSIRVSVSEVLDDYSDSVGSIPIGAMIETPRAALTSGALATHADFFSFGTNDLTQMVWGWSRNDVDPALLQEYIELGVADANPFVVLDQDGVGELLRAASVAVRLADPTIKLSVCGEHAGDPASIDFFVRNGINILSCSPLRLWTARLAAAQSLLRSGKVDPSEIHFSFDLETAPIPGSAPPSVTTNGDTDFLLDTSESEQVAIDIDKQLVLHTLRVRGYVSAQGLTESLGSHPEDLLNEMIGEGYVRHIEARGLYSLSDTGREHQEQVLDNYCSPELRRRIAEPYSQFLSLNSDFKDLCTRWQIRDGEPNDHADSSYDQLCITNLVDLVSRVQMIVDDIARELPRFKRYSSRLDTSAAIVEKGDISRFTGVMCSSVHDIWMELHEDLIVLQGIDRTAEGSF